jgi:hypothetical protein
MEETQEEGVDAGRVQRQQPIAIGARHGRRRRRVDGNDRRSMGCPVCEFEVMGWLCCAGLMSVQRLVR